MRKLCANIFLSVVLVLGLSLGVSAGEIGMTDTTIKVGVLTPLTGPIAGVGKLCGEGAMLAFQEANAKGGVHGRKFEVIVEDNGYDPGKSVAGFKKLTVRDEVFAVAPSIGTPSSAAIINLAESQKVPTMLWMGTDSFFMPPKKYVFMVGMPYRLEIIGLAEFALDELDATRKKFGLLYQDDEAGAAAQMAADDIKKKYRINLVSQQSFKRGAPDVSPQILALKRDGAEVVLVAVNARDMALVLKKSMEMSYKPIYLGVTSSVDQSIFKTLPSGEIDFYAGAVMAPLNSEAPGMLAYTKAGKDHVQNFEPRSFHLLGYIPALVFIKACQVAGRDITREKLIAALEGFSEEDMGDITPPVSYNTNRRYSASSTPIIKMDTENKMFKQVRNSKGIKLNPYD